MALLSRISPLWFFVAFAVGLVCCYLMAPQREVVVKFPSPWNAGHVVYEAPPKDPDAGCFKIRADQVECPADPSLVRPQPLTFSQ